MIYSEMTMKLISSIGGIKAIFDSRCLMIAIIFSLGLSRPVCGLAQVSDLEEKSATSEALPSVNQVLNSYVTALGGKSRLLSIQSRKLIGSIEISDFGLKSPAVIEEKMPYFRKLSVDLPGQGSVTEVFTEAKGWVISAATGVKFKDSKEVAFHRRINGFYRELQLSNIYNQLEVKGLWSVQGEPCYLLECKSELSEPDLLYFSKQSGLLLRQDQSSSTDGSITQFSIFYEEYKSFGGVLYPTKIRVQPPFGGVIRFQIDEIIPNAELSLDTFKEPN